MERIMRFFWDESATAEATSTVVMIAGVGILLAAAIWVWYEYFNRFFTTAGAEFETAAGKIKLPPPTGE